MDLTEYNPNATGEYYFKKEDCEVLLPEAFGGKPKQVSIHELYNICLRLIYPKGIGDIPIKQDEQDEPKVVDITEKL